jgi:hypothetical protein
VKVYVRIDFTGPDGTRYYQGSQIDLPEATAAEQALTASWLTYGLITPTNPDGASS